VEQQLTAQKDTRPCLICSKEGTRHAVEVLPDGGILIMVAHDNGQICKWAEYASILNVARPKKAGTQTYIKCPKCGDRGRLNWAYDKYAIKGERPFTFKYIVVHERVPGTWGGEGKVERRRRCQSFTPEQRITILKQVGRYIADPPKPHGDNLSRHIEPQLQKRTGELKPRVGNNNVPKNGMTHSTMEETLAEAEEENSRARVRQDRDGQMRHAGLTLVPRGKRLTTCTECNKPGYKYRTYFQHYNEPPIGKIILKGKVIGDKYRRCYLTKQKEKRYKDKVKGEANSVPVRIEGEKSPTHILKELDRYIGEGSSGLSKEDEFGKDYKKMYWNLVENLRKIVNGANRPALL
jgi:hypothetical protein